ncbi:hypothetical protein [Hyalangium versicolor]|nr:hypothetical protein [Hyalangium versicolor]
MLTPAIVWVGCVSCSRNKEQSQPFFLHSEMASRGPEFATALYQA